jgi:hypothetical protein
VPSDAIARHGGNALSVANSGSITVHREHYSINYEQVAFRSHPVRLWLPESVDVYITLRGHSYHNYSRYSSFHLFWTGTKQVIGPVKQSRSQR